LTAIGLQVLRNPVGFRALPDHAPFCATKGRPPVDRQQMEMTGKIAKKLLPLSNCYELDMRLKLARRSPNVRFSRNIRYRTLFSANTISMTTFD
jgi:hypothetical protein